MSPTVHGTKDVCDSHSNQVESNFALYGALISACFSARSETINTTMKRRHTNIYSGSPAIEFAFVQTKHMYACENSMTTMNTAVRRAAMESVSELRCRKLEFVHNYAL